MKKLIALAAVTALAACGERAAEAPVVEDTAAATEATTAAMTDDPAGTYTFKGSDGTSGTTVINADGTFETDSDGKVTRGTFTRSDGRDCFDEEGDTAEVCWTVGAPNPDGTFIATSLDGKTTVTVTRTSTTATTTATPAPAAN